MVFVARRASDLPEACSFPQRSGGPSCCEPVVWPVWVCGPRSPGRDQDREILTAIYDAHELMVPSSRRGGRGFSAVSFSLSLTAGALLPSPKRTHEPRVAPFSGLGRSRNRARPRRRAAAGCCACCAGCEWKFMVDFPRQDKLPRTTAGLLSGRIPSGTAGGQQVWFGSGGPRKMEKPSSECEAWVDRDSRWLQRWDIKVLGGSV